MARKRPQSIQPASANGPAAVSKPRASSETEGSPGRSAPAGNATQARLAALPPRLPKSSGRPLYRSLMEARRRAIVQGQWTVGQALPSEGEIGARFGVSRITVRHALQLLQFEGYVRTQRARPAIVLAREATPAGDLRADHLSELIQGSVDAQIQMFSWQAEHAPAAAGILGVPPEQPVPCLRGLLRRDGQRLARSIFYFLPSIGARLRLEDFDDAIVFRVVESRLGVRVADVRMTVWADIADAEDVAQLGCELGSAVLCSRIVYRDERGQPFEVTMARAPAALRSYSFRVKVDPT
jgi:GntR family transcriptional regulator